MTISMVKQVLLAAFVLSLSAQAQPDSKRADIFTVAVSQHVLDVRKQKEEDQKKAQELLTEARKLWKEGKLKQAIAKVAQAQKIAGKDKEITKTLKAMQKQKKQLDDKLTEASGLIRQGKLDDAKRALSHAERINGKYEKYKEVLKQLDDAKKKAYLDRINGFDKDKESGKLHLEFACEDGVQKACADKEKDADDSAGSKDSETRLSRKPTSQELDYVSSFAGNWVSDHYSIKMSVQGTDINGEFGSFGHFYVSLMNDGKTMSGQWVKAPPTKVLPDGSMITYYNAQGSISFTLSRDKQKINGTEGPFGSGSSKGWSATRFVSPIGSWSFGRSEHYGKPVEEHLCNLTLTDEHVEGTTYKIKSCHPDESYWILKGRTLLFLAQNWAITTRFTKVKPGYWKGTYLGSAHSGEGVVYYLKKLVKKIDTNQTKTDQVKDLKFLKGK